MRLSADLIGSSEQRTNPLGERELVLRGLAIPAIEHLGVTRDAFDAIDFSDNRIGKLENFPRLLRLTSLQLSGNVIESLDVTNLQRNISNIQVLNLSYNLISNLYQVANIGRAFTKLEFLNLHGNPVTRRQHYRLYAIRNIPSLKSLDFIKITKSERDKADRLANSAAGAALESDVQAQRQQQQQKQQNQETDSSTKTFEPGQGNSAQESFVTNFTLEQKEQIRELVANAKSPAEIEEIEACVQRGVLPPALQQLEQQKEQKQQQQEEAQEDQTDQDSNNNNNKKRPAEDTTKDTANGENENGTANKKIRTDNESNDT